MPDDLFSPRSETTACEVCGHEIPPSTGAGRPRLRHAHCDQLGKVLSWLEDAIENTRMYLDDKARQRIRYRMDMLSRNLGHDDYVGDQAMEKINGIQAEGKTND